MFYLVCDRLLRLDKERCLHLVDGLVDALLPAHMNYSGSLFPGQQDIIAVPTDSAAISVAAPDGIDPPAMVVPALLRVFRKAPAAEPFGKGAMVCTAIVALTICHLPCLPALWTARIRSVHIALNLNPLNNVVQVANLRIVPSGKG